MPQYDIAKTDVTNTTNTVDTYSVDSVNLDFVNSEGETEYTFPKATEYLGYYKNIPELKKAIDALAIWVTAQGYKTESMLDGTILDNIRGWGEDTIHSIFQNLITMKKIVGDAFAEIIRNDNGSLMNIKPISPERMKIVVGPNGMIKRYEQQQGDGKWIKFQPKDILHLCNDRVGDEIHGTSVVECVKWVIDARHEALTDHRKVLHRNVVPVRIIEVDTDDVAKRNALMAEYEKAINKGEVLVIPKGTVEITDSQIQIQDPISWIQYLENFFYQAVGVPRVIATSQEYTEAASKVGFLTFEPIYTNEQTLLEQDLWNQIAIKLKFGRPPSLSGVLQESEEKNTGQTGIQPNEITATAGRVE